MSKMHHAWAALAKLPTALFVMENSYPLNLPTGVSINTFLIANELKKRRYEVEWISWGVIRFRCNGRYLAFRESHAPHTSTVSVYGCVNKAMSTTLLRQAGLEVAEGRTFLSNDTAKASAYAARLGPPVVIKPQSGGKGKGVTVGVSLGQPFDEAFALAASQGGKVLVERQFTNCIEARFLVTGGRCVAVAGRRPPIVIGNGVDSVYQLIHAKNQLRSNNPHLRNRLIKMDVHRISFIGEQGYQLSDVPKQEARIMIDLKAGFSTGADSVDLTDYVHPSFLEASARAAAAVFDTDPAGVDILARDFTRPAEADNYIICEINTVPGLGGHHFPVYGTPRNVASAIVAQTLRMAGERELGVQEESAVGHSTSVLGESAHEKKVRLIVQGRVRGVGFLQWVRREALFHGIDGWVRNRRDGSIEAVLAGSSDKVGGMLLRCQEGPVSAIVERTSFRPYRKPVAPGFILRRRSARG
jgi:D-alanine-D-alanine ligase-like ATP-grasp enzyme/acylphosphatase